MELSIAWKRFKDTGQLLDADEAASHAGPALAAEQQQLAMDRTAGRWSTLKDWVASRVGSRAASRAASRVASRVASPSQQPCLERKGFEACAAAAAAAVPAADAALSCQ